LINFGRSTHGGWYCNISYLVGEDIESVTSLSYLEFHQLKKSKVLPGQILTMDGELSGDEILITVSYDFTRRKWNLFVREIDLSNFDVNIIERIFC
jgi:hypothetical protein